MVCGIRSWFAMVVVMNIRSWFKVVMNPIQFDILHKAIMDSCVTLAEYDLAMAALIKLCRVV
jgi:hypothetical protein